MTIQTHLAPETSARVAASIDLAGALRELYGHELLRPATDDPAIYMFKHALVQETVHATLLKQENKRLHRLVADALESVNANLLDEYATELAQHYAQAEDDRKTLHYSTLAGDKAARIFANAEALAHYARAIAIAKESIATNDELIHLFRQRGRILEVTGKYQAAVESYLELHELAVARSDRALELGYLMLRAPLHSTPMPTFDAPLAKHLLLDALGTARELGNEAAEARVLWNLCLLSTHMMRPGDGLMYGELSLALSEKLDLPEQKAYTLHDLFIPYRASGQLERAHAVRVQSQALFREMGNLPLLVDSLGMVGQFALNEGKLDQALASTTEGAAIGRTVGNPFGVAFNDGFHASALLERGDYREAMVTLQQAMHALAHGTTFINELWFSGIMAFYFGEIGALNLTRTLEPKASRWQDTPTPPIFLGGLRAIVTRVRLLLGDIKGAERELTIPVQAPDLQGALSPGAIHSPLAEAELALARERYQDALAPLGQQAEWARTNGYDLVLTENLYLQGRGYMGLGEWQAAHAALFEAEKLARAMEGRRLWWRILAGLSDVAKARGNPAAAEDYRLQARGVVEYIAAHMPAEMRAGFLNVPQVSRLMGYPST